MFWVRFEFIPKMLKVLFFLTLAGVIERYFQSAPSFERQRACGVDDGEAARIRCYVDPCLCDRNDYVESTMFVTGYTYVPPHPPSRIVGQSKALLPAIVHLGRMANVPNAVQGSGKRSVSRHRSVSRATLGRAEEATRSDQAICFQIRKRF